MKKHHKFFLVLGYIFTFGILYLVLNNFAKKKATLSNETLLVSNNIPFDVNNFLIVLGGAENIESTSSTISSIKIKLKNKNLFIENKLKNFKPKGYLWNADNVLTILFGDFSQALSNEINKMI
ncbi:hypothetical protein [Mycoplasmoides pirum]|uniref:hypothetical protein n=1 Tax=Mycoplasmoides pirum TaxID=2122 RepID=UPI000484D1B2|nr:hypothetical protein [Mycoplasmoides pirum]